MPFEPSMPEARCWLKPPQAAEYTNISESRLAKLRLFGGGPAYAKTGRSVLYDVADLDLWLVAQKKRSTSEGGGDASPGGAR